MRAFGLLFGLAVVLTGTAAQAGPMGGGGARHHGGGQGAKKASTMKPYEGHWHDVQGETEEQRKAYNKRFGF